MKKRKLILASVMFSLMGFVSLQIQNTYYGYVDENDVMRDSLFLPLGFVFVALGFLFFGLWFGRAIWRRVKT